jgi:ubiquinone/menaquinone biosynthesis C-methylase UbiE
MSQAQFVPGTSSVTAGVATGLPADEADVATAGLPPLPALPFAKAKSAAATRQERMDPAMYTPWARMLFGVGPVRAGLSALDVGCGTGALTRVLAERVGITGMVAAVEPDPELLKLSQECSSMEADLSSPDVDWQNADPAALPFANETFHGVFSQFSMWRWADPVAVMSEIKRVLRPQGTVALATWGPIEESLPFAVLAKLVERHIGKTAAKQIRMPYATAPMETLGTLLQQAQFREVMVQTRTVQAKFASMDSFLIACMEGLGIERYLAHLNVSVRASLFEGLRAALKANQRINEFSFPTLAYVVRGKK